MTNLILNISLFLLIIISLTIVLSSTIRRAVILSGVLSMAAAFTYVLLAAPDIALAQVVIGSTLATIILVIGIKKSKTFTVFYLENKYTKDYRSKIIKSIEKSLVSKDLDPNIIQSTQDKMFIRRNYEFEVLVREAEAGIEIYGEESNSLFVEVFDNIKKELPSENFILKEIYTMKEDKK